MNAIDFQRGINLLTGSRVLLYEYTNIFPFHLLCSSYTTKYIGATCLHHSLSFFHFFTTLQSAPLRHCPTCRQCGSTNPSARISVLLDLLQYHVLHSPSLQCATKFHCYDNYKVLSPVRFHSILFNSSPSL